MIQLLLIILTFVLQTTIFAKLFVFYRPEFFLVVLALLATGRGFNQGLLWGFGLGLFLDIYAGGNYYNTIGYTLLGILIGIFPVDFFQNYRVLLLTNVFWVTLIWEIAQIVKFLSFDHLAFSFPFGYLFLGICLNLGLAYLLRNIIPKPKELKELEING